MGYPVNHMEQQIARLFEMQRPRYRRLWRYYRNPMSVGLVGGDVGGSERPYRQAQEWELLRGITGRRGGEPDSAPRVEGVARKEIVIENDIGSRVDTMVDYLFGRELVIESTAADEGRRRVIGKVLAAVLEHNGGMLLLQQLALLGSVYGFVDVLVKLAEAGADGEQPAGGQRAVGPASEDGPSANPAASDKNSREQALAGRLGRMIRLEIVEPARALPILSGRDSRTMEAYGQCWTVPVPAEQRGGRTRWIEQLLNLARGRGQRPWGQENRLEVELIWPDHWERYADGLPVARGANSLGEIPLAHMQNTAVPFEYSGTSDVEPLIPLQDELNTRLSDRANRITLQSFKMYLGVGIPGFNDLPVAPGRMWSSDNEQAKVIEFGGDASCPSETAHIADLREAMDKASSVTPVAAGAIKNRIGRLTSAAALRVTLLALLSKTEKKRLTYGAGMARMCELALAWLDRAGIFPTERSERGVELHWSSPLPQNDLEKLQEAEAKLGLGVARETVLRELGYGEMTKPQ